MPLITRTEKGSKLTIAEMDGNLNYLNGENGFLNFFPDADNLSWTITAGTKIRAGSPTSSIDFSGLGSPERYSNLSFNTFDSPIKVTSIISASLLTNLKDQGTEPALTFQLQDLSATVIDSLFTQLPSTTETATINVANTPGAGSCDPSIATAKGYTVVTS